jgi:hypothetical protein
VTKNRANRIGLQYMSHQTVLMPHLRSQPTRISHFAPKLTPDESCPPEARNEPPAIDPRVKSEFEEHPRPTCAREFVQKLLILCHVFNVHRADRKSVRYFP